MAAGEYCLFQSPSRRGIDYFASNGNIAWMRTKVSVPFAKGHRLLRVRASSDMADSLVSVPFAKGHRLLLDGHCCDAAISHHNFSPLREGASITSHASHSVYLRFRCISVPFAKGHRLLLGRLCMHSSAVLSFQSPSRRGIDYFLVEAFAQTRAHSAFQSPSRRGIDYFRSQHPEYKALSPRPSRSK